MEWVGGGIVLTVFGSGGWGGVGWGGVVGVLVLKVFGSWGGLWVALCLMWLAHGVGCVWPCG